MRRTRDNAHGDDDQQANPAAAAAAAAAAVPKTIAHPSRYFVPYTGRYYIHFRSCDAKGFLGHNLRLMLHSNGLCVLALDPTSIFVNSFYNLLASLDKDDAEVVSRGHKKLVDVLTGTMTPGRAGGKDEKQQPQQNKYLCSKFHQQQQHDDDNKNMCCPGTATPSTCSGYADLLQLVRTGKVALLPSFVSHTVHGTRGTKNRIEATAKVTGKRKKGAVYVQEVTTLCFFFLENFVRCSTCNKWQMLRPSHENSKRDYTEHADPYAKNPCAVATAGSDGCAIAFVAPSPPPPPSAAPAATTTNEQEKGKKEKKNDGDDNNNNNDKSFFLPKLVKVPMCINGVLLDVNETAAAENAELVAKDPIGSGFLAIMKPRHDVSFTEKFERVSNVSPMVGPSEEVRPFVADSFTGALDF